MAAGAAPRGPQQDRQAEPERHVSVVRRTEPGPAHPRGAGGPAARRPLKLNTKGERWEIITSEGTPVGRLSAKGQNQVPTDLGGSQADARVLAITKWSSDKSDPEYRRGLAKGDWEVVIPEIRITPI